MPTIHSNSTELECVYPNLLSGETEAQCNRVLRSIEVRPVALFCRRIQKFKRNNSGGEFYKFRDVIEMLR